MSLGRAFDCALAYCTKNLRVDTACEQNASTVHSFSFSFSLPHLTISQDLRCLPVFPFVLPLLLLPRLLSSYLFFSSVPLLLLSWPTTTLALLLLCLWVPWKQAALLLLPAPAYNLPPSASQLGMSYRVMFAFVFPIRSSLVLVSFSLLLLLSFLLFSSLARFSSLLFSFLLPSSLLVSSCLAVLFFFSSSPCCSFLSAICPFLTLQNTWVSLWACTPANSTTSVWQTPQSNSFPT